MKTFRWSLLFIFSAVATVCADEEGFVSLFNGKDLAGWIPANVGSSTFTVQEGLIVCTGVPTGYLRSEKMYENYILELDWRFMRRSGNSGVFVWGDGLPAVGSPYTRAVEVQVLDHGYAEDYEKQNGKKPDWFTTHGDVFPIWGAKMKPFEPSHGERSFPSENRSKGSPEWNHYRIEARDGTVRLAVNGKFVSGGENVRPRKGYLCLESEGGLIHFKNIRVKELPSSGAKPEETSRAEDGIPLSEVEGFVPLFGGVDFSGWRWQDGHKGHWTIEDWVLNYDGKSQAPDKNLWTKKEFGDFTLICDWRFPRKPVKMQRPVILPSGEEAKDDNGQTNTIEVADAGDSGIYLRGSDKSQVNIWCWPIGSGEVWGYRTDPATPADIRAAVTPKVKADKPIGQWNRFVITMKGDRLTVLLNGKTVIENAQLPDVPSRGPIALQHHGDPIQFANILIKELP